MTGSTFANTLDQTLGLSQVEEDDLCAVMDWVLERQPDIGKALAQRYLKEGALVMLACRR